MKTRKINHSCRVNTPAPSHGILWVLVTFRCKLLLFLGGESPHGLIKNKWPDSYIRRLQILQPSKLVQCWAIGISQNFSIQPAKMEATFSPHLFSPDFCWTFRSLFPKKDLMNQIDKLVRPRFCIVFFWYFF